MKIYTIVKLGKRLDAALGYIFLVLLGIVGGYAWCWLALK